MPRTSSFVLATDREVQNAKALGQRTEFRIKGARNLVLRITANGTKTWTFLYASRVTGKRCKISLGEYPAVGLAQAKRDALALTLAVRDGKDPLSERRDEEAVDTFEKLAARYIAEHERKNARGGKRSSSTDDAQRLLNADILPMIGTCRAEALTKQLVMSVVEAVADRGAYVAADRVLGLIRAIYNWANATGRLEVDPTLGLKKRNTGRPRERVLSDVEIRNLWQALEASSKLSPQIRDALRLQLLLGVRISEALGAAKNEIDLERREWVIPAVRTKAEREHRLPLSPWAAEIVGAAIARSRPSPWLFPSPTGTGHVRSRSATRAVLRMRDAIALTGIGTHDLRRTLATRLGEMGVPDEVIERVLNHAPRTVTGRHYNHAKHFDAMRHALEAWGKRLELIINPKCPVAGLCASA